MSPLPFRLDATVVVAIGAAVSVAVAAGAVVAAAAAAEAEDLATLVGPESTSRRLQGRAFVGRSKVTQTRFLRKERPIPYYIPKWEGRCGGAEGREGGKRGKMEMK